MFNQCKQVDGERMQLHFKTHIESEVSLYDGIEHLIDNEKK